MISKIKEVSWLKAVYKLINKIKRNSWETKL